MMDSDHEKLLHDHSKAIQAVLRGILKSPQDVEDCCQATFLIALSQINKVHAAARRAWLIQVARNQAFALIRRSKLGKKVYEQLSTAIDARSCDDHIDPAVVALTAEESFAVIHAIEDLPENQREVLRLRIEEDWTFQRIAEHLQIPLGTALTRMRLAVERLKKVLSE